MAIYSPFLVTPLVVLIFAFKNSDFSWTQTRQHLGPNWLQARVIPISSAAFIVWIATLCVLYALPLALQFPFQAIGQCFWRLILVIMTDK